MITLTANSPIYAGYAVSICLTTDERVELTDWNNYLSVAGVIGVATNNALEGLPVNVAQQNETVVNSTWTFIRARPVYVQVSGLITQALPTKNIKKIGYAISSTKIIIELSDMIMVTN